jgi:hypothetical protein
VVRLPKIDPMEAFENPPRVYKREIVDKMLLRNVTLYLDPILELQEKLLAWIVLGVDLVLEFLVSLTEQ